MRYTVYYRLQTADYRLYTTWSALSGRRPRDVLGRHGQRGPYIYIYIYVCISTERERDRERERDSCCLL